jgi:hypothetical protein
MLPDMALSVLPPVLDAVTSAPAAAWETAATAGVGTGSTTGFVPGFALDLVAVFFAVLATGLGAVARGMMILVLAARPVSGVFRAKDLTLPVYTMNCLQAGNKKAAIPPVRFENVACAAFAHALCNKALP